MTTRQEATNHAVRWATEADRRVRDAQDHDQRARDVADQPSAAWHYERQMELAAQELVLAERARQQALMWVQVEPLLPAVAAVAAVAPVETCGQPGPPGDPCEPCNLPLGHDMHRDQDRCSCPTPVAEVVADRSSDAAGHTTDAGPRREVCLSRFKSYGRVWRCALDRDHRPMHLDATGEMTWLTDALGAYTEQAETAGGAG